METARSRLLNWTDCLLDAGRSAWEQRQAAHEWCEWALATLGVDENSLAVAPDAFFADTLLDAGKAISPLGAARCVREYRRTAVFLQAMDAALREACVRFPGETIHVMEAGCGPLAPLALPFALRYPADRVVFTLLDLHPVALASARRLAEELGVADSVRACLAADATTVRFPGEERPHLIACEVLLRALTKEPQVAATLNLAPQVKPGGFFLPQKIEVRAGLFDAGRHTQSMLESATDVRGGRRAAITELGGVFSLDATVPDVGCGQGAARLPAGTVLVPPHDAGRESLELFTRIQVWGGHVLGDFESSLNLPERVSYPEAWARDGGRAEFFYEVARAPGLRLVECAAQVT